jgi:hypothetical protein
LPEGAETEVKGIVIDVENKPDKEWGQPRMVVGG